MSQKPPSKHRSQSQPPSLLKSKTAVIAGVAAATALAYKLASSASNEHEEEIRQARENAKERFKDKIYGEERQFVGPMRPREHASDTYHGVAEYLKDQVLGENREFGKRERRRQRWEEEQEERREEEQEERREEDAEEDRQDWEEGRRREDAGTQYSDRREDARTQYSDRREDSRTQYSDRREDARTQYSDRYSQRGVEDDFERDDSWRRRVDRAESRPGWVDIERSHGSRRPRDDYSYEEHDAESYAYEDESHDHDYSSSRGRENRSNAAYRRGPNAEVPRDYIDRPDSTAPPGRSSQRSRSVMSPPSDWPEDEPSAPAVAGRTVPPRRPEDVTSEDRIVRARKDRGLPVNEVDESVRREGEKEKKHKKHKKKDSKDGRDKSDGRKGYPFVEPVAEETTYVWDGKRAKPEEVTYYLDRKAKS